MIWKKKINLNNINNSMKNTMAQYLEINIEEVGDNFIRASMPVNEKTIQPFGILNGGASVALAETIGSVASNLCLNDYHYAVGLDINANHIKSVKDSFVEAITKPIHIGRTTHVWEIKITQREKLTCLSRLTTVVLDR